MKKYFTKKQLEHLIASESMASEAEKTKAAMISELSRQLLEVFYHNQQASKGIDNNE